MSGGRDQYSSNPQAMMPLEPSKYSKRRRGLLIAGLVLGVALLVTGIVLSGGILGAVIAGGAAVSATLASVGIGVGVVAFLGSTTAAVIAGVAGLGGLIATAFFSRKIQVFRQQAKKEIAETNAFLYGEKTVESKPEHSDYTRGGTVGVVLAKTAQAPKVKDEVIETQGPADSEEEPEPPSIKEAEHEASSKSQLLRSSKESSTSDSSSDELPQDATDVDPNSVPTVEHDLHSKPNRRK